MNVLMLLAVTCWAANIVAGKEALRGFGAGALAELRVMGAGLLYVLIFLSGSRKRSVRLTRREWLFFIVMAASGVTLNQLFFIAGLDRSSVAHTGLIVALGPVMVLVLACLMRLEALTVLKLVGMLIAFAGVGVLTFVGTTSGHWTGDMILLAGTVVFSYYTILMKEVADRFDALTLNMLTFALGAVLMLPFAGHAVWAIRWRQIPGVAYAGLAFMIVLGTVVPYLLFAYALTGITASRVAAFSYFQSVIATALGIWLLSEKVNLRIVVGGALILLGVYFSERGEDEVFRKTPQGELKLWF